MDQSKMNVEVFFEISEYYYGTSHARNLALRVQLPIRFIVIRLSNRHAHAILDRKSLFSEQRQARRVLPPAARVHDDAR